MLVEFFSEEGCSDRDRKGVQAVVTLSNLKQQGSDRVGDCRAGSFEERGGTEKNGVVSAGRSAGGSQMT